MRIMNFGSIVWFATAGSSVRVCQVTHCFVISSHQHKARLLSPLVSIANAASSVLKSGLS